MKHFTYYTKYVCARQIDFDLDGEGRLRNLAFVGGCDGNLKALGRLCEGEKAETLIEKLLGVTCDEKPTSCSDQLARSLRQALQA